MTGAIIGDIVGSPYEFHNIKSKEFPLFNDKSKYTDDSLMTLAVAKAVLESKYTLYENLRDSTIMMMKLLGRNHIDVGFGDSFFSWISGNDIEPYNSYGNGAAMRISPIGWAGESIEDVIKLSRIVTEVTHNHPDGIKGAEVVATSIYLALNDFDKDYIRRHVSNYYDINFTLNDIRSTYKFYVKCEKSVPQAIVAFLESYSFEDAIRNAISIGGDSDTIAAITGSIAEAYYGIPNKMRMTVISYLKDINLYDIISEFEKIYGNKIIK